MTRDDIAALVAHEVAHYRYAPGPGLLGRPWSPERVTREVEALRAALVAPRPATLHVEAFAGQPSRAADAWVVVEAADGTIVAYEPATQTFWLVFEERRGILTTYGVFGDLVGTFMAR